MKAKQFLRGVSPALVTRDAFCELVKSTNQHLLKSSFEGRSNRDSPVYVTHIHDGADLRFRSKSAVQQSDASLVLPSDALRMSRSRMSKVQNSSVAVRMDDQSLPYYTELQALGRKDAASFFAASWKPCWASPAAGQASSHPTSGDRGRNQYKCSRPCNSDVIFSACLGQKVMDFNNWQRSSHRANLVAQFVVCSGQRNSALRANCSRIYKYIMPAYADEIGANIRAFVLENMALEEGFPAEIQSRPDWDLLQLYGKDIFPIHLRALLNVDVRKLRHRCPPGTSLPSINGELFALLCKLVCVVESKPVVTRYWTFFQQSMLSLDASL